MQTDDDPNGPPVDVGLVGYGIMGAPMAKRLIENGHRVTVFDADDAALTRAAESGCVAAATPSELAAQCPVIVLSLPRPEHVRLVVAEGPDCLLDGGREGTVIADTSTVDPQTSRDNARLASRRGVGYLDCPVLGRPSNVGGWTIPAGGEAEHLEQVRPVLQAFAREVIHLGPVGRANTLKLLNNLMFGAINSITAEVLALSDHLDIERRLVFETIADSGAATVSSLFVELGRKMVDDEFTPNFSVDNLIKDVGLGIEMATAAGVRLPLSEVGQAMNQEAQDMGLGGEDSAAVVKIYNQTHRRDGDTTT